MKKSLLSSWQWALGLLAVVMLVPQTAWATTIYTSGSDKTVEATQLVSNENDVTLQGNYYVTGKVTLEGTIYVKDSLTLYLLDDADLTVKGCIVVEGSNKFEVNVGGTTSDFKGSGKMTVTDENSDNKGDNARIGSRQEWECGNITINGGTIFAYSTYSSAYSIYAADLGSGYKGWGGTITINGGKVCAYGGYQDDVNSMSAAAIGSGYEAASTAGVTININGGEVQAYCTSTKTSYAAAIGTGEDAESPATINITGGTVKAISSTSGESYGAGIGTGQAYKSTSNTTVNISGGWVLTASSSNGADEIGYGAGIGMGEAWKSNYGKVDINITGGTVNAFSGYYKGYGSAIGGGENGGCGTITISSSANVKAFNCQTHRTPYASGIGDGKEPKGGSLTIFGISCVVDTWGTGAISSSDSTFTATGFPQGQTMKVETGDTYETATSTQEYTTEQSLITTNQWCHISFEETNTSQVYYTDANGNVVGPIKAAHITGETPSIMGSGSDEPYYYYLEPSHEQWSRPTIKGHAVLILADARTQKFNYGIHVSEGNTLTITAGDTVPDYYGSGKLQASNYGECAAIGSDSGESSCGTINIYDGKITATGAQNAAALGGGSHSGGGTINLTGGTVNATSTASPVGAGANSSSGTLNLTNEGNLYAISTTGGVYSLNCSSATATPGQYRTVHVKVGDTLNVAGTPTSSAVDLVQLGLCDTIQNVHVYIERDKYVLRYNSNGGRGLMNPTIVTPPDKVEIRECKFTNGTMTFIGWNTAADGTGTWYQPGDSATFTERTTLYAQWSPYHPIYYLTADGDTAVVTPLNYSVVTDSTDAMTSGTWVVYDNVTVSKRIYVNKNDVTLILRDSTLLDAALGGIEAIATGKITITVGDTTQNFVGNGKLIATGGQYQAGIGGGYFGGDNTIKILGGDITATGGYFANSIGDGFQRFGSVVSITGGKVKAIAGEGAYALGNNSASLTIGGTADVIAQTSNDGTYALYFKTATATPDEGYYVFVQDANGKNISNDSITIPSVSQVNLNGLGLQSEYQYVHIFFGKGLTLAEALEGDEDVTEIISNDLYIIQKTDTDQVLWCTDDLGNWVKVVSDDYETLKSANVLQGNSIQGKMSDLDTNPVFTLTATPTTADVGSKTTIEIGLYDVVRNFSQVQPDEIAFFNGYYFVENGTPKLRGYGGTSGHKGQSLVLDITKYVTGVKMTEGNNYSLLCAIQINAPWDEEESSNAPRRVSKSDGDSYFTNYTAYALAAPEEVTGITENMLNKEVDHIDYVNTIGQVSDTPWQGVNIVVTHYSDGSTSTAKVVK